MPIAVHTITPVAAHPQGLAETEVICTTGQPCAHVYQSLLWTPTPAK